VSVLLTVSSDGVVFSKCKEEAKIQMLLRTSRGKETICVTKGDLDEERMSG
jgi:hypothetical protein